MFLFNSLIKEDKQPKKKTKTESKSNITRKHLLDFSRETRYCVKFDACEDWEEFYLCTYCYYLEYKIVKEDKKD
jgi:hypothetical protein